MRTLDSQQVRALLKAAEGHRNEALYYLAVTTGMRLGELLGLCWTDVDWETARLRVQRQAQTQIGGMVLTELKSASSRRQITLGPVALEKLRERRERYELERLFVDERWREHDLIFPAHEQHHSSNPRRPDPRPVRGRRSRRRPGLRGDTIYAAGFLNTPRRLARAQANAAVLFTIRS